MTDRDIMNLALEALESAWLDASMGKGDVYRHNQAITALRERLAQPEQTAPNTLVVAARKVIGEFGTSSEGLQDLYQALKLTPKPERALKDEALLAQPEQELVAWRNAAIRVGEELSSVGPDGYYDMTAEQWLDWAMAQEPRGKNSLEQPEQEPVSHAGIKIWIGDKQVVQHLTQTQLHYAIDPWMLVELTADKCIAALKEKVND
tara:strand:- start:427 stop:1041 length:615 start_codon:yes stop_codon:yes gene_type:complete